MISLTVLGFTNNGHLGETKAFVSAVIRKYKYVTFCFGFSD